MLYMHIGAALLKAKEKFAQSPTTLLLSSSQSEEQLQYDDEDTSSFSQGKEDTDLVLQKLKWNGVIKIFKKQFICKKI